MYHVMKLLPSNINFIIINKQGLLLLKFTLHSPPRSVNLNKHFSQKGIFKGEVGEVHRYTFGQEPSAQTISRLSHETQLITRPFL